MAKNTKPGEKKTLGPECEGLVAEALRGYNAWVHRMTKPDRPLLIVVSEHPIYEVEVTWANPDGPTVRAGAGAPKAD